MNLILTTPIPPIYCSDLEHKPEHIPWLQIIREIPELIVELNYRTPAFARSETDKVLTRGNINLNNGIGIVSKEVADAAMWTVFPQIIFIPMMII
jgi:hypothetical protein